MCGIFCIIHSRSVSADDLKPDDRTHTLLVNRGPDANSSHTHQDYSCSVGFLGYVLWQQGVTPCEQPLVHDRFVLLMNGDIYSARENYDESDTQWLLNRLIKCQSTECILDLFRGIKGPYSIIFFDKKTQQLYFLRDSIGRQTLLLASQSNGGIVISSVVAKNNPEIVSCIELPPLGLFRFDLRSKSIHLNPWKPLEPNEDTQEQIKIIENIFTQKISIENAINPIWLDYNDASIHSFNFQTILSNHIKESPEIIFNKLLENLDIVKTCDKLIELLTNSIQNRINATPTVCKNCVKKHTKCNHSRIGILFSGGVDCTILARIVDKELDPELPIDLINVSFEKVSRQIVKIISYDTPDRLSARDSLKELQQLNSDRKWNLIEINVTREELNQAQSNRIRDLVNPLCSILDESLGSVLWFGASGSGTLNGELYSNPSRVLLIGSGADELFGGYTRHRNAFIRIYPESSLTPYENLEKELNFDLDRLPSRNLARDDRVIGDFGITARSPFLEEDFINFVRKLRAHQKCFHSLDQGVGDKLILRLCAHQLGLKNVTSLKKRAMQFGSRIADRKQNAKDISEALC